MEESEKEIRLRLGRFWLSTMGRYLHEASVLILVFGGLDQVEGKIHLKLVAMIYTAVFAIVLFLVSGILEWIGKEN